ncbi:helix-turn-helix domain-containing protein [Streptomyces sp. NPDC096040]|uniref:helix-turn-helix domain-containing protein n=1 Tax=Streptomyces sp. NPDC096040 TaxID=3155541 RepID=UPI00331944D4
MFGYLDTEIAGMLDRSPASVGQLARRPRYRAHPRVRREATERFVSAALGGDIHALMEILAPDVTVWIDGGGVRQAAGLRPVHGRENLAPMIEREILWRLITGEQGVLVRQIGLADSRLTQIGRAVRFIRDHFTDPLRVEDLARLAGMSASPFHRHFRAVTAMTPIQCQKHIRLQEARLRLMSSTEDVADIGHAVGYDSASQFSREYRRRFGRPPGADAARLRTADGDVFQRLESV